MEIVLGVTGGIAAYKAAEIVRELKRAGAAVTVVMTEHALHFITPLTLQTLSGRRVITSHFDLAGAAQPDDVEHVGLARGCDLLLVAPATAGILAKMAAGVADDFLSTFHLAVSCPVAVAPAMNTRMWRHPAVQDNVARLRARGVHVIGPDSGPLASAGEGEGEGRLAEPKAIVTEALELAGRQRSSREATRHESTGKPLAGRRVLVTAGPTCEDLDPVRTLTNRSTGRMGFALAAAARDLGADVVLITGPTHLPDPPGLTTVRVRSAEQMRDAVMQQVAPRQPAAGADVVVMAAAVSDFRPSVSAPGKVGKSDAPLVLSLTRTPDILAEVGRLKGKRFLVGFAAETENLVRNARRKLREKRLDLIVANSVAGDGPGGGAFGAEDNEVTIIEGRGRPQRWPRMSKQELALRLMSLIAGKRR